MGNNKLYIKDIAKQSLEGKNIVIPNDVYGVMKGLMGDAIQKKSEYKSFRRKYDLKRVVRIKGSGYEYGESSKNAKYDLFNATEIEKNLEKTKEELAQILLDFLFLKAVYSNPEGATQNSKIKIPEYPSFKKFLREFFGVDNFSIPLEDFSNNGVLTGGSKDKEIGKKSVVYDIWSYKIQSGKKEGQPKNKGKKDVVVKVSDVLGSNKEVDDDCIKLAKFPDSKKKTGKIEYYVNFLERVYTTLARIDCDREFHDMKSKVAEVFDGALKKSQKSAISNITNLKSAWNAVNNQYKELVNAWEISRQALSALEQMSSKVDKDNTLEKFTKTREKTFEALEKLNNMKDDIIKGRTIIKYFDKTTTNSSGSIDFAGVVAGDTSQSLLTRKCVVRMVGMVTGGEIVSNIIKEWQDVKENLETLEDAVERFKN